MSSNSSQSTTKVLVTESNLTNIADSIRAKNGSSDTYNPSQMSTAISNIKTDLNWEQIGYSERPYSIDQSFNYAKTIYDNWDSTITNCEALFKGDNNLVFMPDVDTSNVQNISNMFHSCYSLTKIPSLDTSSVRWFEATFTQCKSLKTIPLIDTSSAKDMINMFYGSGIMAIPQLNTSEVTSMRNMFGLCASLEDVPVLDTSLVTDMENMFTTCNSLTNTSLNNILTMCINATNVSTKTLKHIGLS